MLRKDDELTGFIDELKVFFHKLQTMKINLRTATIIHGFALLHVAAAILCRLGGITDDMVLTSLTILLIVTNMAFPITGREFAMVQKDIARRKGTESSKASNDEKAALQRVTGFAYDSLWSQANAGLKR